MTWAARVTSRQASGWSWSGSSHANHGHSRTESGMNRDFAEMLDALSGAGAEFMIVGAHALAAHGRPRATGDLDIWVRPTPDNAKRVWSALLAYGAPLDDLKLEDLSTADVVFQIGVAPARIDILTTLTALN